MRFYLATLFCIITWMNSVQANNGLVSKCLCLGFTTTRPSVKQIKNYTIQSGSLCPNKVIVFLTKIGKRICSDPEKPWVQRYMQKVDKDMIVTESTTATAMEEKEQVSTTAMMKKVDMETTVSPVMEEKEQGSTTAMEKVDTETTMQPVMEENEQGSTTAMEKVNTETTVSPVMEEKEQGSTTAMEKVDTETTMPPVMEEKEQGSTTAMEKVNTEPMVPPVMTEKEKDTSIDITPAASRASKKIKPKRRRTGKKRQRKTTLRRMRGLRKRARA